MDDIKRRDANGKRLALEAYLQTLRNAVTDLSDALDRPLSESLRAISAAFIARRKATMLYKATHTTKYSYNAAVSQCQSEVRLTPRTLPWQTLVELTIQTTPPPASVESHKDYFGNEVRTFTILESHDRFSTVATSLVEVEPRESSVVSDVAWEHVRDELAAHSSFDTLEAFEFVFDSPMVTVSPELSALCQRQLSAGAAARRGHRGPLAPHPHRIPVHAQGHAHRHAAPRRSAPQEGVCQDFAHVMIGAVRSMRLAARYVSGYLRSGPKVQGAEASHAWVSVVHPWGWLDGYRPDERRPPGHRAHHARLGAGLRRRGARPGRRARRRQTDRRCDRPRRSRGRSDLALRARHVRRATRCKRAGSECHGGR